MSQENVQASLSQLQAQLGVIKKRNRRLLAIAISLAMVLLIVGITLYNTYVWQYAVLEDVRLQQSSEDAHTILFSYKVDVAGLAEFWHGDARLLSHVNEQKSKDVQFSWRWDNRGAVTVRVRYRRGFFPVWDAKEFQMQTQ